MNLISTLRGSLMENYFPAGWDLQKIDRLGAVAGADLEKRQAWWHPQFEPWACGSFEDFDTYMGHEIAREIQQTYQASRPLALSARPQRCNFCPENFQVGVEAYGGLGTHAGFGLRDTSHYVAPTVAWTLASGTTFKVSPSFGVTGTSAGLLLRFGVSYEIAQFGRATRRLFHNPGGND